MHGKNWKHRKGIAAAFAAVLSMSMGLGALVPGAAFASDSLPKASGDEQYEQRVVAKATSLDDTQGGKVIAHEGDLWLLGYDTKDAAESAAKELDSTDDVAASVDSAFGVAEGATIDPNTTTVASADDNPITNDKSSAKSWKDAIALIDTGASGANVIDKVTVLSGSADDDMGHGTKMAQYMAQISPTAKVVSVKALDSTGTGTISSVVAAMDMAIKNHAKVINLSISAKATEENSVLKEEIQKAWDNGVMVVGAAGNDGQDASGFVPGGIDAAFVVGACDSTGAKLDSSNYGKTVDYNVHAASTSEAAAKASAWLDANVAKSSDVADVNEAIGKGLFYPTDPSTWKPSEGFHGSGTDGSFHTQMWIDSWTVSDVTSDSWSLYCNNMIYNENASNLHGQNYTAVVWLNSEGFNQNHTSHETAGSYTIDGRTYNAKYTFQTATDQPINIAILYNLDVVDGWGLFLRPLYQYWTSNATNDQIGNEYAQAWYYRDYNTIIPINQLPTQSGKIVYDPNGGAIGQSTTVGYMWVGGTSDACDPNNKKIVASTTRYGYRLQGYYLQKDGGQQIFDANGELVPDSDGIRNGRAVSGGYTHAVKSYNAGGTNGESYVNQVMFGDKAYKWWVAPFSRLNGSTMTLYAHWQDIRYWIEYDGNGADTGTMENTMGEVGNNVTLTANAYKKAGYEFAGWNTAADGSGQTYKDAASVASLTTKVGSTVKLYAQWHATYYTINYDKNASDATGSMTAQKMASNQSVNLNKHGFARFGYEFTGWSTDPTPTSTSKNFEESAAVKDLATAGKTITLYAQWKAIDTSVAMSSGTFYVKLHAGETAHINGLPAGTRYTVEEQAADGWTLIDSSGTVGQIASRTTSEAWFKNKPYEEDKYQGNAAIVAYKTVDGTQPADGASYSFQLKDSDGNMLQTKQSNAGGIVTFDPLKYYKDNNRDDAGKTFTYTVSEVKGDDSNMSYDTHVETVTVEVSQPTADAYGQKYLPTSVKTDSDGVIFDNTHKPGTLVLKKAVQGTSDTTKAFTFEARLVDADGKPVTSISAAVLDAQGKGASSTRTADDGVYTFQLTAAQSVRIDSLPADTRYTVSEKAIPDGYAYVSSDGTEGAIESDVTKTATITNSYSAAGKVSFEATKQVTGLELSGWSFELLDTSGKVISTATSDSDGKVSFSPISYRKNASADDTGTHVYTIREVKGTRTDVKYDSHVLTEKVDVADDGAGNLVCTVTSSGSSTFVNTPTAVMPETGSDGMLRAAAVGMAVAAASIAGYLAMRFRRR